jgi:DNA mismatch endonuclease (patch repair protein)
MTETKGQRRATGSPPASSPAVSAVMRGNRGRDTKPETALRSELHRRGLRFRKHVRLAGAVPDVAFPRCRVAVFVDGCFWHGCPEHFRPAIRNTEYWSTKISRNRARDERVNRALEEAGWTVIRVWEHEDVSEAAQLIDAVVRHTRSQPEETPRS